MNQYLDWIYCKIIKIEPIKSGKYRTKVLSRNKELSREKHEYEAEVLLKRHTGKPIYNFIRLVFSNLNYSIIFSNKFLESKKINLGDIQIGKVLGIQPKIQGEILGIHMINDVELRNKAPKIWKRIRVNSFKEIKGMVYIEFKVGNNYCFSKKFLEYKGINLKRRKRLRVKQIGRWVYDIK